MDDLLEWLTGCLDHLDATAKAATAGPWQWGSELCWSPMGPECGEHKHGWGHMGPDLNGGDDETVVSSTGYDADQVIVSREDADHIALHDPRVVLARVQAERLIVADSRDAQRFYQPDEEREATDRTVRLLAWGHRFDFPGYREDLWAPEGADRG